MTAQERAANALEHFTAAAAADPKNVSYQIAVAYLAGATMNYEQAQAAADAALQEQRRDPLLYLLRGQAEAMLVMSDPVKAGDNIGKAMTAFNRAAELDPQNSLPVFQAVSVALDVDRLDLALPRLKKALALPTCRLYQLPVPTDLQADKADSLLTWEQLQMGLWSTLLSRCQNVSAQLLRLGREDERTGKLEAAEQKYRQALQVAHKVGEAEPRLMITVGTAIDMLNPVYTALAHFTGMKREEAEKTGDMVALRPLEARGGPVEKRTRHPGPRTGRASGSGFDLL